MSIIFSYSYKINTGPGIRSFLTNKQNLCDCQEGKSDQRKKVHKAVAATLRMLYRTKELYQMN